jgi:hypothetical protein
MRVEGCDQCHALSRFQSEPVEIVMRSAAMRASAAQRRARARSNSVSTSRDEKAMPSRVSVRMLSSERRAPLMCPNAVSSSRRKRVVLPYCSPAPIGQALGGKTDYSGRMAMMGSITAARRAGTHDASAATNRSATHTAPYVARSSG